MTTALIHLDTYLEVLFQANLLCPICAQAPWTTPAMHGQVWVCADCAENDPAKEEDTLMPQHPRPLTQPRTFTAAEWRTIEQMIVEHVQAYARRMRGFCDPNTPEYSGYTLAVLGLEALLEGWKTRTEDPC
jgi:hypothetical protein